MGSNMPIKDSAYSALALYWKIYFIGQARGSDTGSGIEPLKTRLLTDFSFLKYPIDTLEDNKYRVDITNRLENIGNIDKSVDFPNITEFRVGELQLTLNDDDRIFDPRYETGNIYSELDSNKQNGYRIEVEVYTGFLEDSNDYIELKPTGEPGELVFKGEIHKIDRDVNEKTVSITCIDMPNSMYDKSITDFGLEKSFAVQGYYGSSGGEYPLPLDIAPLSNESVSGYYFDDNGQDPDTHGRVSMTFEKSLSTSGVLRRSQAVVSEDQINTALPTSDVRTSDGQLIGHLPIFHAKVPFRDKTIKSIIEQLLEKYETEGDIELPDIELEESYFSSNGRIGYDIENKEIDPFFATPSAFDVEDVSDFWRWRGFVTDFIANSDGSKFMFLYSARQTFFTTSKIIEYDVATDTYTDLHTADSDVEYWSITSNSDFTQFYVLGTEAGYSGTTPIGTYDSAEQNSKSRIWIFTKSGESLTDEVFVAQNETHRPQLAKYLHLGFGRPGGPANIGNNRLGMLPFSNRLILYPKTTPTHLYYLWANRIHFGVARKPLTSGNSEAILTASRDTYNGKAGHNHGGCAFYIEGNTLFAAFNFINYSSTTSNFKVVSRPISS